MSNMRVIGSAVLAVLLALSATAQTSSPSREQKSDAAQPPPAAQQAPRSEEQSRGRQDPADTNQQPPRSEEGAARSNPQVESSSRDTKIDLSAPPGEEPIDLGRKSSDEGDTHEMQPWDPHKAEKNVEVGDFYYKRGNYAAAINRYRDALYWKSNDATATYRLAQALEQVGQYSEARKSYQAYLKILPKGDFAADSQKALERLKDKPDQAKHSSDHAIR